MKWSKYSYLFFSPKYGYFIYNSVTNSFVRIQDELKQKIENIKIWDKTSFSSFSTEFQEILLNHKIIVNEEEDKEYYLKKKYAKYNSAFNSTTLSLTIATTTGCNFACPYCFEKGAQPVTMNEQVEEKLINFADSSSADFLKVTWYGGEPLMNFETIKRLSQAFKELNKFKQIDYGIVTNGYFLTEEKYSFLAEHNVKSIQITIDGLPETHNKSRIAKNRQPTFEPIVSNIDKAAIALPDCRFTIRVNISKQNGNEYAQLYKELMERWKDLKNISIYFSFVEDYGMCDVDCYNSQEKIKFIRELREKYHINSRNFYPRSSLSLCVANSKNGYVVSANGDLYKCWSDLGKKDKVVGSIMDGKLTNYSLLAHYALDMDKFSDDKCKECFLFPVCSGGCPQHRYTTLNNEQKHDICPYESVNIDAVLEMIYEDYQLMKTKTQ